MRIKGVREFKGFITKHPILVIMLAGLLIGALIVLSGRQDGSEMTEDEYRIKELVESLEGVDNASVIVNRTDQTAVQAFSSDKAGASAVTGIAVTANGADIPKNRHKIIELLSAAYSLPTINENR